MSSVLTLVGCGSSSHDEQSDAIAVGLVPVAASLDECPLGANRERINFLMDDDDGTHCSCGTGVNGGPRWVPPTSVKPPIQWDGPDSCTATPDWVTLHLCRTRVAGDAFRPLTADPEDSTNFYAVMKFGDSCPPNSTTIGKTIKNEDTDNENRLDAAPGAAYPNQISGDLLGNSTVLYFCFFRAAPSPAETMSEFPELGFPYAVYHDFDAEQPDWVIEKRWEFSDDENAMNPPNPYFSKTEGLQAFENIIENPAHGLTQDTYFDLARVR